MRRVDLFRGLIDEEIDELTRRVTIAEYAPGQLIVVTDLERLAAAYGLSEDV